MLASVTRGVDFSFRSTSAKSTGNENAGYIFQLVIGAIREGFSIDKFKIDSAVFARGGVGCSDGCPETAGLLAIASLNFGPARSAGVRRSIT